MQQEQDLPASVRKIRGLFDFLQKHFVVLRLHFTKDGKHTTMLVSAFLLSVLDEWFVVTAGHCLDDVDKAKEAGYELKSSDLIDGIGTKPKHKEMIPFNYEDALPISLDKNGYDAGVLRVNSNQRQLLEANDKYPMNEETWEKQPDSTDSLILVGIPAASIEEIGAITVFSPTLYWVDEVERDDPFNEKDTPTLYGRVDSIDPDIDIKGVSGGPIFGFGTREGRMRYWLIALQSGWNKSDRRIAAPRTQLLGRFIKKLFEDNQFMDFYNSRLFTKEPNV